MITNDFVLSFAIAGGTIIVQKIIEPIFEGQELNMPNGNYTVETITRTEEFGSFTKLTESFELYYGETDDDKTTRAVINFQQKYNSTLPEWTDEIAEDGIWGPQTYDAMLGEYY